LSTVTWNFESWLAPWDAISHFYPHEKTNIYGLDFPNNIYELVFSENMHELYENGLIVVNKVTVHPV
jgi:hypothetical protein